MSAPVSPLSALLNHFRQAAQTEREKGTYFEELIVTYLRTEPVYADLYQKIWKYADWAKERGIDARDTGIDLVAQTRGTDEFHAIQCKFYDEGYRVRKEDIDSFFTASGQKPFTHRIIVSTTNDWTENADLALFDQNPPVTKLDLYDLENSQIDWSRYQSAKAPVLKQKKTTRPHQKRAISDVLAGLANGERGKLIMACGTGKTFTSLKVAEEIAGTGGRVLFLVPSLSLLSQSLTEWTQESQIPLHSFAVCSDSEVGKKRKRDEDTVTTFAHELRYPATTDPKRLAVEFLKRQDKAHLNVVFSTYHSIEVVAEAQKHGLPEFDLIVCDEAHRTTGATFEREEESNFVKVHDAAFLKSKKRLYMTATPRIYGDSAKATAEKENAEICSMDDAEKFGDQLHVITFSEAVQLDLLCDYKVIVLTISADHVSERLQNLLKDENNQLKVDDAARIVGCWKALAKQGLQDATDADPMRRAVAFCQVIDRIPGAKHHRVSSKEIAAMFAEVVKAYREKEPEAQASKLLCEARHVDGSMGASLKEERLAWLKSEPPAETCRILSNVRCLSEGVDVPALDAVLFLTPRNSQVDVVQSVGRVMRKDPAGKKKRGYVILPVVIPAGMDEADALNDNKVYKVVWEVLQALRSHDDQFDAFINKLDLVGKDTRKMEVISITDKIERKAKTTSKSGAKNKTGVGQHTVGEPEQAPYGKQAQLQFNVGELEKALYARVVKKCGNRSYWDEWAKDIAQIAQTHIARITQIVSNPENVKESKAFSDFANELRDDLNDSITDAEVIEMLAQHLITKPVFDALFSDYSFASNNPVSLAMQHVLDVLQEHRLEKEAGTLDKFYASVKMRADGIDNAAGKQKIVVELYDKFFRNAFPRMTERLGIVYTPVEVVDFIIRSVNDLLKDEFDVTLGTEGVHIIDPFTGTGTFVTRLLQSGLIPLDRLPHKYTHEIHANEIVLLAYYIAAINIEAVYHGLVGGKYQPFEGICLTDTFQLYEKGDLISNLLVNNSARRKRQKALDIRVIVGNPPYSVGQTNANDNNQNVSYPDLDNRITETYAARSEAALSKGLYDSYVRAIRWASDRIGSSGVIGFVTNASFLEVGTTDGLRKCLADEFSSIYIVHLRGNARTSGEQRRKEKDNVFGQGTRTPVAITFLVKNPNAKQRGCIRLHNIGDYLSREEKLTKIDEFKSVLGIGSAGAWQSIVPNGDGDWLKQRDESFEQYIVLGDKKGDGPKVFDNFSLGVVTNRDAWCYNASKAVVAKNVERMIAFYNSEVDRFVSAYAELDKKAREAKVDGFVNNDQTKIKWTRGLKQELTKGRKLVYQPECLTVGLYRPFNKQWLYFNRQLNEMVLKMPGLFPGPSFKNVALGFSSSESRSAFSVFITDNVASLHAVDMVGSQYFPLYLYEKSEAQEADAEEFFTDPKPDEAGTYKGRDCISAAGLAHFQAAYPAIGEGDGITRDDVFYYIYGLLHAPDYRSRFADNLGKEIPRIPVVKTFADFRAFSQAGRDLARLHLNYETEKPHAVTIDSGKYRLSALTPDHYRVKKMRFASKADKSVVIYNEHITIKDIPLKAYEYVVNGKPALEWVMERQAVMEDKESGIVNDANLWGIETMENPRYPLELFQRVITVSLETLKTIEKLPALDI